MTPTIDIDRLVVFADGPDAVADAVAAEVRRSLGDRLPAEANHVAVQVGGAVADAVHTHAGGPP